MLILVGQQDDEIELRKCWSNAYATVISGDAQTLFLFEGVQQLSTKWEIMSRNVHRFAPERLNVAWQEQRKVCLLGGDNPL